MPRKSAAAIEQAELILHLYELRREIQPYLAEFRKKMKLPEWMISIQRLIEGSTAGRKRLVTMQKNLAAMAEERARL